MAGVIRKTGPWIEGARAERRALPSGLFVECASNWDGKEAFIGRRVSARLRC